MIFDCAWSFSLLIKDTRMFYVDWERLLEVLVMIVVLSFLWSGHCRFCSDHGSISAMGIMNRAWWEVSRIIGARLQKVVRAMDRKRRRPDALIATTSFTSWGETPFRVNGDRKTRRVCIGHGFLYGLMI